MRLILFSLAWAAGFAGVGGVVVLGLGMILFRTVSHQPAIPFVFGAEIGLNAFVFAFCFATLHGARLKPENPPSLGLLQAIWCMAGFVIMMLAGGTAVVNLVAVGNIVLIARRIPPWVVYNEHDLLVAAACAGEVAAGWWVIWMFRRLGPVRQSDGSAAGLAWRPAPLAAYLASTFCACVIIAFVLALYHIVPPHISKLASSPMARLFNGSALSLLPLLFIITFLAPVVEELVFRGIAFGGIAARLGPIWAGIITTAVFTAVHYQEKIFYPPGFLDVALLAAAAVLLRLRFNSIRPGILMHMIYNAGAMLAAAWFS